MGIFCMVFGVALFLGTTAGGYMLAHGINSVLAQEVMGQTVAQTLKMAPSVPVLPVVLVCAFIGLLIGLSFFMKGLTHLKVCRIAERLDEE